ncbi:MAG: VCBS repeat-containing protein [Gemmatimonadota bacterium]|nr:VCBS repeat-containing protein [Gemmatimonadota bacterium]
MGDDRTRNLVFLDDGSGRFKPGPTFGTPSSTRSLTLADLDGDLDIVVANVGAQDEVYFNRGGEGPEFGEFRFGCGGCATYGAAVGDLNGDGFPEIVTANSGAPNGVFANVGVGR